MSLPFQHMQHQQGAAGRFTLCSACLALQTATHLGMALPLHETFCSCQALHLAAHCRGCLHLPAPRTRRSQLHADKASPAWLHASSALQSWPRPAALTSGIAGDCLNRQIVSVSLLGCHWQALLAPACKHQATCVRSLSRKPLADFAGDHCARRSVPFQWRDVLLQISGNGMPDAVYELGSVLVAAAVFRQQRAAALCSGSSDGMPPETAISVRLIARAWLLLEASSCCYACLQQHKGFSGACCVVHWPRQTPARKVCLCAGMPVGNKLPFCCRPISCCRGQPVCTSLCRALVPRCWREVAPRKTCTPWSAAALPACLSWNPCPGIAVAPLAAEVWQGKGCRRHVH